MATTPPHHRLVPSVLSRHGSSGRETSALHSSSRQPAGPAFAARRLQSGQGAARTAASSRTMSNTRRPTRPASTFRAADTVTSAPLPSARIVNVKAAIGSDTRTLTSDATAQRSSTGTKSSNAKVKDIIAMLGALFAKAPLPSSAGNAFAGMLDNFAELFRAQSLLHAGAHVQDRLHDAAAPTTTSAAAGGVVAAAHSKKGARQHRKVAVLPLSKETQSLR